MEKLYIAYGSNLNLAQMASRCPTASIYAKGVLNNWELIYRGTRMNSHATIKRKKGAFVPVLVWNIQPHDEARLDVYEGYPMYYFKKKYYGLYKWEKEKSHGLYYGRTTASRPALAAVHTHYPAGLLR